MKFRVLREETGEKLCTVLKGRLGEKVSSRQIRRMIDAHLCRINGQVERYGTVKLKSGDWIEVGQIAEGKCNVIFEDDAIIAYNKQAGLTSEELGRRVGKELVHRLDRDTTGVILFPKTAEVKEKLEFLFRQRKISKEYLAVVEGSPKDVSGEIKNKLAVVSRRGGQVTMGKARDGKEAITRWEMVAMGMGLALLRCRPETGRTHQVRVHLKEMGCPILGDVQYCRSFSSNFDASRHLLHAASLRFEHPLTGALLVIEASFPKDFQQAVNHLRQ